MFSTKKLRLLVQQYIIYEVCWDLRNSNLGMRWSTNHCLGKKSSLKSKSDVVTHSNFSNVRKTNKLAMHT